MAEFIARDILQAYSSKPNIPNKCASLIRAILPLLFDEETKETRVNGSDGCGRRSCCSLSCSDSCISLKSANIYLISAFSVHFLFRILPCIQVELQKSIIETPIVVVYLFQVHKACIIIQEESCLSFSNDRRLTEIIQIIASIAEQCLAYHSNWVNGPMVTIKEIFYVGRTPGAAGNLMVFFVCLMMGFIMYIIYR